MHDISVKMMALALVSALLAAPMTVFLLRRFRRSVIRGMQLQGVAGEVASSRVVGSPVDEQPSAIPEEAEKSRAAFDRAERSLARTVVVYAVAGLTFALTLAVTELIQVGRFSVPLMMYLLSQYIAPVLFAIWIALPRGRTRRVATGVWVGVFLVLLSPPILGGSPLTEVIRSWMTMSGSAAFLIGLFMFRRVRAAGPLVLTIVGGALFGVNLIFDAIEANAAVFNFFAALGNINLPLILIVGSIVGGIAVVPVLRGLGELHERKYLSDQSLVIDIVFLWFAATYAVWVGSEAAIWMLCAPVAFALYKGTAVLGFRILAGVEREQAHTDILLLRPFSLGRRSELLFDQLSKVWLRVGAIHMIAGPDLVMATVAPSEFLVFLSGRLSRRFIRDQEGLRKHLEGLDLAPDPDGRHRTNQLFCGDDVWRDAMRGLAARSRMVLMDLRGFSSANKGCVYELGELIRDVPLGRIVFAVDTTTDSDFTTSVVRGILKELPGSSPNALCTGIASRVVSVDNSAQGMSRLLKALMEGVAA